MIKELKKRYETPEFIYIQHHVSEHAYLYKVWDGSRYFYEVFKRKVRNNRFSNTEDKYVVYPKSNAFGYWAWTYRDYEPALIKFNELTSKLEEYDTEKEF